MYFFTWYNQMHVANKNLLIYKPKKISKMGSFLHVLNISIQYILGTIYKK